MRRALLVGVGGGLVLGVVLALLTAVNPEPDENGRAFAWFMGRALVSTAFVAMVCGVLVRTVSEGTVVGATVVLVGIVVVAVSAVLRALAGVIAVEDELVPTLALSAPVCLLLVFPSMGGAALGTGFRSLLSRRRTGVADTR